MTYEVYRYIFIGAAILCGVMAAVSILLFILLRIPSVIGDLSGKTAKKAIEEIRKQNEASGGKNYRSSAVNRERGKLTDKISKSGSLLKQETGPINYMMETEKIDIQQPDQTDVLDQTCVLEETAVLDGMGWEETAVLSPQLENTFVIEHQITFIHTDEIISLEQA